MNMTITETITTFVRSATRLPDLTEDDQLFETGIINSLFAVQLITFLEKTFGIDVGPDDLDIRNFASIKATAAFVTTKNRHALPVN
jgi:acyl carrier protein